MNNKRVLITGGCGFVGSNLAVWFKQKYRLADITVLDNLKRRGSELNLPRLAAHGIRFVHGDIRNREDICLAGPIDLIIECAAEASVLAGRNSAPEYVINTNLQGTINLLDLARSKKSDFVFLSSSRVYPIKRLNDIDVKETETRYTITRNQTAEGVSALGVSEWLNLGGSRSLYGSTKLCAEYIIQEYGDMYGLRYVINRCSNIAGPWQFGNVDQGVFTLWLASHYFEQPLKYIGWGGSGKQVRDYLAVDDLARLLDIQICRIADNNPGIYNVGGGILNSLSMLELTNLCREVTGNTTRIEIDPVTRPADIKTFITDYTLAYNAFGWNPRRTTMAIIEETYAWIRENEVMLKPLFVM